MNERNTPYDGIEDQMAAATLEFLKTSTIQGSQIQLYVACHNWLQSKVDTPKETINVEEG